MRGPLFMRTATWGARQIARKRDGNGLRSRVWRGNGRRKTMARLTRGPESSATGGRRERRLRVARPACLLGCGEENGRTWPTLRWAGARLGPMRSWASAPDWAKWGEETRPHNGGEGVGQKSGEKREREKYFLFFFLSTFSNPNSNSFANFNQTKASQNKYASA